MRVALSLSGHTGGVNCVRWGGEGCIYSASRDRTIKVWDETTGATIRTLAGHGGPSRHYLIAPSCHHVAIIPLSRLSFHRVSFYR